MDARLCGKPSREVFILEQNGDRVMLGELGRVKHASIGGMQNRLRTEMPGWRSVIRCRRLLGGISSDALEAGLTGGTYLPGMKVFRNSRS